MLVHRPPARPCFARARVCADAFTLLELLVVLGLIGIAAAIALPRFDRSRVNVDAQALSVRGVLIIAQRAAVTRGLDVLVVFDTARRLLRVQEDPNGNMALDAGEVMTATAVEGDVSFSRGSAPQLRAGQGAGVNFVARQSGRPVLVFHRDGSASEAGVFYLTTTRSANGTYAADTRAFDVQRATGRAVAYRYDGTAWRREF